MSARAQALCAALLAVSLAACGKTKPLTQLVIAVDSDWDGIERVDLEIDGFDKPTTVHVTSLKGDPFPRRVAVVHDGGPLGPIAVTARAYAADRTDPVLVEPRSKIYFVKDETRLLKIDLHLKCAGFCDPGLACIDGPHCLESDKAAHLEKWNGDIDGIKVVYHVKDGDVPLTDGGTNGSMPSGPNGGVGGAGGVHGIAGGGGSGTSGGGGTGGGGAGSSGEGGIPIEDAGDSGTTNLTPLVTSNVDSDDPTTAALPREDVVLDCATPTFDSSDLSFSNWCGPEPAVRMLPQDGAEDAVVLVMSSLDVASGTTLRLEGDKPIILLVYGSASIEGTIDASAHGTSSGPGADSDCSVGLGVTGEDGSTSMGSAGGGGGGFGSAGGNGASGDGSANWTAAGVIEGDAKLVPLRGGCAGGRSGDAPNESTYGAGGGGGGAIQISVLGRLDITGKVLAVGGGGEAGEHGGSGAGGGGSGGAILLEAMTVAIGGSAVISTNGGSGGAGQPYPIDAGNSSGGEDGHAAAVAATGGTAADIGGKGGNGAWRDAEAGAGGLPTSAEIEFGGGGGSGGGTLITVWGGGGGGGGGVGRIRINHAATCSPSGTLTPAASVMCSQ